VVRGGEAVVREEPAGGTCCNRNGETSSEEETNEGRDTRTVGALGLSGGGVVLAALADEEGAAGVGVLAGPGERCGGGRGGGRRCRRGSRRLCRRASDRDAGAATRRRAVVQHANHACVGREDII